MKKGWMWVLLVAAIFAAAAFTGCKGADGKVYLTVTCDSAYGAWGGFETGLGLPSGWSLDTKYPVNAGTWKGIYNLADYYGYVSSSSYHYWYDVNSMSSYLTASSYISESSAAYIAYSTYGDYVAGSITLEVDKGKFLADGTDRNYVLDLGWYVSGTTLTYDGEPMARRVVTDTPDKLVVEFSGAPEKITLSFDKKPASNVSLKGLSMSAKPGDAPANLEVKEIAK